MRLPAGLAAGLLLAACQTTGEEGPATSPTETAPAPSNATTALPEPQVPPAAAQLPAPDASLQLEPEEQRIALAASQAPQIYMAIQQDGSRPISVIFAIDESRDGTPENDPAIRLTPTEGECNPQAMRSYDFPSPFGDAPVFGSDQVLQGVSADQLPSYLAIEVSQSIMALGIAGTLEDTRPQNICTRKLWEAQLANPVERG